MNATDPPRKPLTRTAMHKIAARARRHGFYDGGDHVAVRCPQCHDHVVTTWAPSPNPKDRDDALDHAMIDHLRWECPVTAPDHR